MRGILRLAGHDIRRATGNVMAIIVLFGLVVIPALFTWFNVIASWDPFSNTKNLTVAVASTDEGYVSDLVPLRVNVGEQVLSALRANDQLNWVITSKEDAIDGTKSGEYYAAIVLPESFSADMMTFYAGGSERTRIDYYVNEKKNALAPKITEQGADGISRQISEVFDETLAEVALGIISTLSDYLSDADTQAALTRLEARVGAVATQLRAGAQTARTFTALIASSQSLAASTASLIRSSGETFDDAAESVGSGIAAARSMAATMRSASASLAKAIEATVDGYDAVGNRVDDLFAQADSLSGSQSDVLNDLAAEVQLHIDRYTEVRDTLQTEVGPLLPEEAQDAFADVIARLDAAIDRQEAVRDRLQQAAADVTAANDTAQDRHQEITDVIAAAKKAVQDAADAYSGTVKPQLDRLASTLAVIDSDLSAVGDDLQGAASRLTGASGTVQDSLSRAQAGTQRISDALTETATRFDTLQDALAKAADTGDLSALSEIIGSDPAALAASLAEPVRLERTAVFPVASFGAGMAPLYAVLSLWVGALLMAVTIRVDVDENTFPEGADLSPGQTYLGRYGIFALGGLAQSSLMTLGLIGFVRIEPAHPFLLVLAGWVASLVFTLLIYTAVVAFGSAGKALSVLFLVVQISGSGGAYPLQLLPEWFQNISPFLPATHAVNAMRAAIAGVYEGDFWVSLGLLGLFVLPALLLGLVLRRPLIGVNRRTAEALAATKLM